MAHFQRNAEFKEDGIQMQDFSCSSLTKWSTDKSMGVFLFYAIRKCTGPNWK